MTLKVYLFRQEMAYSYAPDYWGYYNTDYMDEKYLSVIEIYATGYLIQAVQVSALLF